MALGVDEIGMGMGRIWVRIAQPHCRVVVQKRGSRSFDVQPSGQKWFYVGLRIFDVITISIEPVSNFFVEHFFLVSASSYVVNVIQCDRLANLWYIYD